MAAVLSSSVIRKWKTKPIFDLNQAPFNSTSEF